MITDAIDATRFWLHDITPPYTFTNAQIQEFLDLCRVPDALGYHPAQTLYTPTYDVLRAAGYGWMWLSGVTANKSLSYKIGDVAITVDKTYCLSRARELMGSSRATATRVDEPYPEHIREHYYDGEDPRHR